MSADEVRARTRDLLDDCQHASPSDPDIRAAIDALIGETTRLTECVLTLMPADAAALADALATAHTTLAGLVEAVERREASVSAGSSPDNAREPLHPKR